MTITPERLEELRSEADNSIEMAYIDITALELSTLISAYEHEKARADKAESQLPRWRPMDEAPGDGANVLGITNMGNMLIIQSDGDEWRDAFNGRVYPYAFSHWMPLPQAPEVE